MLGNVALDGWGIRSWMRGVGGWMGVERLVVLCCFHIQCMALESGSKMDTGFRDGVLKVSFAKVRKKTMK